MEKFDIIVKPNIAEEESVSALEENDVINKSQIPTVSYYVPCLIKSKPIRNIVDSFKVDGKDFNRTSWICMHFDFLPPAFFNHFLVNYIRRYQISLEPSKHRCRPALYRGMGVFNLDSSGLTKLAVCEALNPEMLNYVRLAKSVTDLMPEMMAEHLKSDGFDIVGNTNLTSRSLFTSFQLQNKYIPTTGKWASSNCPNEDTEISIGDDIQRWRFVLTELKNHSKISEESFVALANVLANVFIRSEKKIENNSFEVNNGKYIPNFSFLQKVNNGKYIPNFSFLQKVNNGKYIPNFSFLQKVNNGKYIPNLSFLQKVNNGKYIPNFSFLQKVNNGKYIPTFSFLQKVNNGKYIPNLSFLQKENNGKYIPTFSFLQKGKQCFLQKENNGKYTPSLSFLQKVNNSKYIPNFSFLQKVNNGKYIPNFSFLQKKFSAFECYNMLSFKISEIIPDTFEVNIRRHYQIIIQEISVSQILDQMMTHCSLSIDDRRHIEQHVKQIERNKALLDIVIDRNRTMFKVFIDALRESGYDNIADQLSSDLEDVTVDTPCIRTSQMEGLSAWTVPLHKVRLQKNYVDIISIIKHEAIVDHLISCEVFTIDDQQTIEACPAQTEKNRKLMDRLLHCGEKCFIEFLNALRSDEIYADLANQIEQTDVTSIDISTLQDCYSNM
ncbi:unnamed protein product [Mytilus edulis]|uniref:CARD domain-containing protein n=1 Tax=Mytilus edulis TaxID=6550 RepID=A0A8S3TSC8_MYTED|nr:unnamed protein product [Mytilus edulis]